MPPCKRSLHMHFGTKKSSSSPGQPHRSLLSRRSEDACTPPRWSPPERPLSDRLVPGLLASCPGPPPELRPRWDAPPRPGFPALYPGPWDPGTQAAWWMQRRSTLTFKNLLLSLLVLKLKKTRVHLFVLKNQTWWMIFFFPLQVKIVTNIFLLGLLYDPPEELMFGSLRNVI